MLIFLLANTKKVQNTKYPGLYQPGDDLLSREVSLKVPSTLQSLTYVFGMGTGVSSAPLSPDCK